MRGGGVADKMAWRMRPVRWPTCSAANVESDRQFFERRRRHYDRAHGIEVRLSADGPMWTGEGLGILNPLHDMASARP